MSIKEQPNTTYDLNERIKLYGNSKISELHDICVEFDATKIDQKNFQMITNLANIINEGGEVGIFELEIFKIYISAMNTYEKDLILIK